MKPKLCCFLQAKTASSTVGVVNDSLWQLPTTFPFLTKTWEVHQDFLMVWKTGFSIEQILLWVNLVIFFRIISFRMTSTKTILTIAVVQVVFIHWISYIKEKCTAQPSFAGTIYSHTEISSDTKFLQRVTLMRKKSLWLDQHARLNIFNLFLKVVPRPPRSGMHYWDNIVSQYGGQVGIFSIFHVKTPISFTKSVDDLVFRHQTFIFLQKHR